MGIDREATIQLLPAIVPTADGLSTNVPHGTGETKSKWRIQKFLNRGNENVKGGICL